MKKALLLLMLFIRIPSGHAQTETYKNVDSTLYAYYRWCNNNIRDSVVVLKADTLFRLAGEKNDIRMQAVALSFKADHYYFNNEPDSLKAWIPRVQAFARANDQPTYYFFTWSRLILYYTKHGQYTLAQYELERYMAQAEQDDYKPAIAEAYKQLGHIYRTRGLKESAADYYRKAIGFIEENNLSKFSLPILYSELATVLIDTGRYEEAAEELEKGKARLTLPEYIWPLKLKQVILYSRTGRSAEARTLFDRIRQGHGGYLTTASLTEAQLAIDLAEHEFGKALATLDKLIGLFKETGHSETYFYKLFQTRAEAYAETGNYEAAYKSQKHYLDLYRKKVGDDNERTLGEFATLLDVSRLDVEKAELRRQTQEVRLHRTQLGAVQAYFLRLPPQLGIAALSLILLLTVLFLLFTARMNRRLAHAKRAAEASSRMKGVFIRNITHEINTPLNSIVGFAELAAAPDADDEKRQSYIEIIRENSGYLQKLVDDVLYIAGLESSDPPPALGPVDINVCCMQCIQTVRDYNLRKLDIRFEPECAQLPVNTSCLLLSKALTELLRNAARFAPDGRITLAYTLISHKKRIAFTVTDRGPGIPAAEADRIFDRFVKLDPFSQGMGLGLAVCRLIADALGGGVELDTSYTEGARFTLTIPIV